jgi:L,D-peptidoglycan transpeptidase YkuD (ErfK/YbiS/YcfS/YnhG family)
LIRILEVLTAVPPRRWVRLALLAVLIVAPIWIAGRMMITIGQDAPVREAFAVRTALEGARRARAREFASAELAAAQTAADLALLDYTRAVSVKTGFLRYDVVRARLLDALKKADFAWMTARHRGRSQRNEAVKAIGEATTLLAAAEGALDSAPIGSAVRADLARARVSLGAASARLRQGRYDLARHEASVTSDISKDVRSRAASFLRTYTTSAAAGKWDRWIRETIALSERTGDYVILVDKLKHKCHLYRSGRLARSYTIDLGGPIRDKQRAGDRATPEGMYRVVQKRARGQTTYYKALLINYPNDEDRAEFATAKRNGWVSRRAAIGGLIEIHGEGGRNEDWTLGCMALANRDMDELFRLVDVGTPVTIVGTIGRPPAPAQG